MEKRTRNTSCSILLLKGVALISISSVLVAAGVIFSRWNSTLPREVLDAVEYDRQKWDLLSSNISVLEHERDTIARQEEEFAWSLLEERNDEEEESVVLQGNQDDGSPEGRLLSGPTMFHAPLSCNPDNFDSVPCQTLDMSVLGQDSNETFVVPCGSCYELNIQDGSTVVFPHGIRIEGKLFLPSEANVTLSTTFVFVFGLLKIATPEAGRKVNIHLFGEEKQHFFANSTTALCGSGCELGSKVVAVLGGKQPDPSQARNCFSF